MASVLVPTDEMKAYLGNYTAPSDTVLEQLIISLETLFLRQCGRPSRAFQAAETGRVEVKDGTGSATLWLDYPVSDLTEVLVGIDVTDPDETLDVTDVQVLAWQVGDTRVVRRDGGRFGCVGDLQFVQVTYDAQADLPQDAKAAIMRVTATMWRQMGSEDVSAERIGPYDATYLGIAEREPLWQLALANHREVRA